jgi:hypothetical protein
VKKYIIHEPLIKTINWDGTCMQKKQNQQIKQLKKETILWKQRYSKMLIAYFELHSYCTSINKENQQEIEKTFAK